MTRFTIIDNKFKKNIVKYIFQCVLATLTILAVLLFLNILTETAIITALGASTFIVFTMPKQYSSDSRRLFGGYLVGLAVGFLFYLISTSDFGTFFIGNHTTSLVIYGALAVGAAILIMIITNTEHAPAAGIALGLVINKWDYVTIIFIILAVIWMYGIKTILRKYLIDLISPHTDTPNM